MFYHDPKDAPGAVFREFYDYGPYEGTSSQIDNIIAELRPLFPGDSYNILSKNCNSFADALLERLVGHKIPGFVNRMAYIGGIFSFCVPPSLLGDQPSPVDQQGSVTTTGNNSNFKAFTGTGNRLGRYLKVSFPL